MVSLLLTLKSEILVNLLLFRFMLLIPTVTANLLLKAFLCRLSHLDPTCCFQGDMPLFKHRRWWGREGGEKSFPYKLVQN